MRTKTCHSTATLQSQQTENNFFSSSLSIKINFVVIMMKVLALLALVAVAAEAGSYLHTVPATTVLGGHSQVVALQAPVTRPQVVLQSAPAVVPSYYGRPAPQQVLIQGAPSVAPQYVYGSNVVPTYNSGFGTVVVPQNSPYIPSSNVQYVVGGNSYLQPLGLGNGQYILSK